MTDYLVLGGGLAGCTMATRLKRLDSSASVALIEAGPDEKQTLQSLNRCPPPNYA